MNATLILGVVAIALFVGAYLSKRRFGVLAAGLAIGWALSSFWVGTGALMLQFVHIIPYHWTNPVAAAIIIVAPAIILIFHGPRYKTTVFRIVGAFLFTVLAITFIVMPLAPVLSTPGVSKQVVDWFETNRMIILSGTLALAVADLFLTRGHRHESEKKR